MLIYLRAGVSASSFFLMWGCVSAPTGCSPRDSGRLLGSRVGSFLTTSFFSAMSAAANAKLREQLGGTQAALRAKEAKFDALAQERDRLAKRLPTRRRATRRP